MKSSEKHNALLRWYVYDELREVTYDDKHACRRFKSKKEVHDFFDKCSAVITYVPFMRDLDDWDFNKRPYKVCMASGTKENGEHISMAFGTRMYVTNDKGDTLEHINLF